MFLRIIFTVIFQHSPLLSVEIQNDYILRHDIKRCACSTIEREMRHPALCTFTNANFSVNHY